MNMNINYKNKYLKYKNKYLKYKLSLRGGSNVGTVNYFTPFKERDMLNIEYDNNSILQIIIYNNGQFYKRNIIKSDNNTSTVKSDNINTYTVTNVEQDSASNVGYYNCYNFNVTRVCDINITLTKDFMAYLITINKTFFNNNYNKFDNMTFNLCNKILTTINDNNKKDIIQIIKNLILYTPNDKLSICIFDKLDKTEDNEEDEKYVILYLINLHTNYLDLTYKQSIFNIWWKSFTENN